MQTEFELKRPIDGITLDIIRAVHDATTALGHRAMLVGATDPDGHTTALLRQFRLGFEAD